MKNCYYIGTSGIENSTPTNTYKTTSWDDTYAYYTIGQGTVTDYTAVRWNNNNVTEWLISDGGNTVGGSFASSYTLGGNNDGDNIAIFRSSYYISR